MLYYLYHKITTNTKKIKETKILLKVLIVNLTHLLKEYPRDISKYDESTYTV